jgi:hypothetical protein
MRKVPPATTPARVAITEKHYAASSFLKPNFVRDQRDEVHRDARNPARDGSRGL